MWLTRSLEKSSSTNCSIYRCYWMLLVYLNLFFKNAWRSTTCQDAKNLYYIFSKHCFHFGLSHTRACFFFTFVIWILSLYFVTMRVGPHHQREPAYISATKCELTLQLNMACQIFFLPPPVLTCAHALSQYIPQNRGVATQNCGRSKCMFTSGKARFRSIYG